MQTTAVYTPVGQPVGAASMQNVVILPQYVVAPQQECHIWTNYASKMSILGITQIWIGVLCLLANSVEISAQSSVAMLGHGIWGGLFFMLTGAFGMLAGRQRTTCPIITFMTLSILSASIFAVLVLSMSSIGITFGGGTNRAMAKAMGAAMLALSLLEIVVAVCSAAICCSAICCRRRSQSGIVMQQGAVMTSVPGTQVLYTTGTSYPQTGNMFQQQVVGSQQQQFGGAPTNQVPQSAVYYPQQYTAMACPLPYVEGSAEGAAVGPSAPRSTTRERKVAL